MDCRITREDCKLVVEKLIEIIQNVGLGNEVSFFVYGSYFGEWRDGLSDLDAILYFSERPPLDFSLRPKIEAFQSAIGNLYEEMPFTKSGHFFSDIFIQDIIHGSDGRFFIYDKEKTDSFQTQPDAKMVFGQPFLDKMKPVSLRHEQEIELAHGLAALRNYLFFEIPKRVTSENFSLAKSLLKYFRILPRRVSIINGGPMEKSPDVFKKYSYLEHIDYEPFMTLWENTNAIDKMESFLRQWHESGSAIFRDCLECFEKTLIALVENAPMLSRY